MAGPVAAGWTGPTSPAARPRYGSDRLLEKPLYYVPLALLMATSGFVMFEPAPYDVFSIGVMLLFLIGGMILTPGIAPLLTLLMMFFASGFVAATQTVSTDGSYFYIVVTTFLGLNAVFFAFVVAMNPVRAFNVIMAGYVVAGLFTAIAAIGGYFGAIPFSDSFLLYGRAKGTFQDPNVMGPFLIPPTLFLLSRIIRSRVMFRLPELGVLLVLVAAIFLSFSRGAWGHMLVSGGLLVFLHFATARRMMTRIQILLLAIGGIVFFAVALSGLASIEHVRTLLAERAHFTQAYDVGEGGRFSRHIEGAILLAGKPLGLGPREFGYVFTEDPHNTYLKAFSAYGWLAGISYVVLIISTVTMGAKHCILRTPWQNYFQVAYASFVGLMLLGFIIDTDRWRHFWLLIGLIWGMMAAYPRYARSARGQRPAPGPQKTATGSLRPPPDAAIDSGGRSVAQPG